MNRTFIARPRQTCNPGALPQAKFATPPLVLTFKHFVVAVLLSGLTSCAFLSRHQFALPGKDWQARSGQLMYRNGNVTVVGDVLVRFSRSGDFELTFSKGPGITLFTLQQDANFAQVKSGFAHLSWSGQTESAPAQLRGWLSLREKLLASQKERVVRHTLGPEKFVFRF